MGGLLLSGRYGDKRDRSGSRSIEGERSTRDNGARQKATDTRAQILDPVDLV